MIYRLFALFWCGLLGLQAAVNEPRISATMPWTSISTYVPVILDITSPVARDITLTAIDNEQSATVRLTLSAGEHRSYTLLLPAATSTGSRASISWYTSDGISDSTYVSAQHDHCDIAFFLVGSEADLPSAPWQEACDSAKWSQPSYSSSKEFTARGSVQQLPDRWQGYPNWLSIVLSRAAQVQLSPSQRQALAQWTHMGGSLYLCDQAQAAPWQTLGARVVVANEPTDAIIADISRKNHDSNYPAGSQPIAGTEQVPTTAFMIVAVIFAILAGPINFLWVKRTGRRHLLLISTPILSIATCVILLLADIVLMGLSARRNISQLVLLDQPLAQASVSTNATYYAAFTISELKLNGDTLVQHRNEDSTSSYRYRNRSQEKSIDLNWTTQQIATGSWIPARTTVDLTYRSIASERRRVDLRFEHEQLLAVNGFDQPIEQLTVRAPDGRTWTGKNITVGSSTPLTAASLTDLALETKHFKPEDQTFPPVDQRLRSRFVPDGIFSQQDLRMATNLEAQGWAYGATLNGSWDIPGPDAKISKPPTCMVIAHIDAPQGTP